MSDLLFALARLVLAAQGLPERVWRGQVLTADSGLV
jgi:hypothetical protein